MPRQMQMGMQGTEAASSGCESDWIALKKIHLFSYLFNIKLQIILL